MSSSYLDFDRPSWARLRAATPLTLSETDLAALQGINEQVSLAEVETIYLPVSRLLNLHVSATQALHKATDTFLGALPRVVDIVAARPQVQERLGEQIADAFAQALDCRGVLVVLDAVHECVTMRGGKQPDASTVTIAARGELAEPVARAELVALITGEAA